MTNEHNRLSIHTSTKIDQLILFFFTAGLSLIWKQNHTGPGRLVECYLAIQLDAERIRKKRRKMEVSIGKF